MKIFNRLIVLFFLLVSGLQQLHAESFTVDRGHSAVGFSIRHLISTVHGRFTRFTGKIEYDSSDISKFSIEMVIQDSSINTDHERRDQHLRSQDFFWVDSFPTITFKSTKAYQKDKQFYVDGDFTMRGITKNISVPFEVVGTLGS